MTYLDISAYTHNIHNITCHTCHTYITVQYITLAHAGPELVRVAGDGAPHPRERASVHPNLCL